MTKKLIVRGVIKWLSGVLLCGLLLFLPAGTWHFTGAWRMMGILFLPMLLLGSILLFKAPDLLEKRLGSKENEPEQKKVILLSALMFTASFLLCGFDFRMGWTRVPLWLVTGACMIFFLTYAGFAELLRENDYLSRTVEIQEGQRVVSTGLYGVVRHPMYSIILLMFFSLPLIIGSFAGVIPLFFLPVILVRRIENEEKVLEAGLKGYTEYMKKVRYRLIPLIW